MPGKKSGGGATPPPPPRTDSPSDYHSPETKAAVARETRKNRRRQRNRRPTPVRIVEELNRKGKVRLSRQEQKELVKWKPQIEKAMRGRTFDLRGDFLHLRDRPGSAVGGFLRGIGEAAVGSVMEQAWGEEEATRDLGPDWLKDSRVRGAGFAAKTGVDFQLGPDARKAILSQEGFSPAWAIGGGLMGVLPFKGGTGTLKGASGAVRGGKAGMRTLQLGEHVQQFPTASSRVTRKFIEKPADRVSNWLQKEESKAAKALNLAFPTARTSKRVARGAGRHQEQLARDAEAKVSKYFHALPDEGSVEDQAHYWWAQMPKKWRNVAGLQRLRSQLDVEFEELMSGRVEQKLAEQIDAVRVALNKTDDPAEIGKLTDRLTELNILYSDLPLRKVDLPRSMAELDRVIAEAPAYNDDIIQAVRALAQDRKEILIAAKALDEDTATEREGLVSGWLGLDGGGDEVFMGHRSPHGKGLTKILRSGGTGKVRLPEGVSRPNRLILAKGGRLRASTHVSAQDWRSAQVYRQGLRDREILASMGEKFDIERGIPEGHVLVNPKGRLLPRNWKADQLAHIEDEATEEELRQAAEDIIKSFIHPEGQAPGAFVADAKKYGVHWSELRTVPIEVVNRYYGAFSPLKVSTKGGRAYDTAVDYMAASIIFLRIGYIPKNIAQNLIMSVPHQGPFLLMNAPRAGQVLLDQELNALLSARIGFSGSTAGVGREFQQIGKKAKGLPHKGAEKVGKIADNPLRISAFLHEAAKEGVIPRFSAKLSDADKQALKNLFLPENEALLNNITWRATDAMADFTRLNPTQRKWARRFLIIPGWLWAGSRYPIHFAATHPGRSAAIAYGVAGAPGLEQVGGPDLPSIKDFEAEGLPYYVQGLGGEAGKVFRTTSLSPVSTPWEILQALMQGSERKAGSYANPVAESIINLSRSEAGGPRGHYPTNFRDSLEKNLRRLAPNFDFAQDMISPPQDDPVYPGDKSRFGLGGRLARELGVFPIEITRDKDTSQKGKNDSELDALSTAIDKHVPKQFRAAEKRVLKAAYARKTEIDTLRTKIQKETESGGPYYRAIFPLELDLAVKWKLMPPRQAEQMKKWAEKASDEDVEKEVNHVRDHYLTYNEQINSLESLLESYGWKPEAK